MTFSHPLLKAITGSVLGLGFVDAFRIFEIGAEIHPRAGAPGGGLGGGGACGSPAWQVR